MRISVSLSKHENPVIWSTQKNAGSPEPAPIKEVPIGEFDSGSERTLAAWFRHASRTIPAKAGIVAEGLVTRGQSTLDSGITFRKKC